MQVSRAAAAAASDHELVSAVRSGTVEAFSLLVDRHYPAMLRYLSRQTGDPALAADVAQESFLAAFRSLHQLTDDRSFAAWLYRIARNVLRMEQRRRRLHQIISLEWLSTEAGDATPALRQPDRIAAMHQRDLIQQVLDQLNPNLREALLLHRLWGFSSAEVADILGISLTAARKRISRADMEFRAQYQVLSDGDDAL